MEETGIHHLYRQRNDKLLLHVSANLYLCINKITSSKLVQMRFISYSRLAFLLIKGNMSFILRLMWSKKARNHEGIHPGANPFFRLYNQNYEYLFVSKNKQIITEMASIRKMRSVQSVHEIVKVPQRANFRKSPQNVTKITNVWVHKKQKS